MKAVALSLIAAATVSANEFRTVTVSVDKSKVLNITGDLEQFHEDLQNATYYERSWLEYKLADAFKTGTGKLVLNFGKTVVPVARDWARLAETTGLVDPEACDYECATNLCFDQ